MTYLTIEMSTINMKYPGLPYYGVILCLLFSIVHVYLQNAELFFVVFAILLSPALIYSGSTYGSTVVFNATKLAGLFLALGFTLWQIDRSFCTLTHNLYLHSWWHIFTALSEIYWLNAMVYRRREIVGQSSQLVFGGLWIKFNAKELKSE